MSGAADRERNGDHLRWEHDLAAYALEALDVAERVELERHLEDCERCRTDLAWLRPAVGALAGSVPQLVPPRRLRRATLATARSERPGSRDAVAEGPPARIRWLSLATAGIAAVAIAVAGAGGYVLRGSGPDTSTVAVEAAADEAGRAEGVLVAREDAGTLEVEGLPRLSGGDVYQAWLQRGEEIEPSTTFIVDRRGSGATTIPDLAGADRVMVTREPRGGSDAPSTAPLLTAPLDES